MLLLGGLLHRMIFWELVKVFALTLTSLTGLFLVGLVIQQANQLGLSLGQTLAAIPLLVPYTLPYTIPATTLFASCVVYGRLSHDNEAVAMKAAGVNLFSILRPAVILGLLTTLATFALAHSVIPKTQSELQARLLKDPEEVLYNLLRRERTFRANNFPYVIHVRDVIGRRLIDVTVKQKNLEKGALESSWKGDYSFVMRAREAKLRVVMPGPTNDLAQPMIYIDPDRWVGGDGSASISGDQLRPVAVPLPDMFSQKDSKDRPMNLIWDELPPKANEFRGQWEKTVNDLEVSKAKLTTISDPAERERLTKHIENLQYVRDHFRRQVLNTENEYFMRPALALGCLVFAVIGCPVGIWANRADYLSAFVTCFLPTVFAYYPLLLAGSNMGRDGKIPLPMGVFAADAIIGVASVFLIFKLIRR